MPLQQVLTCMQVQLAVNQRLMKSPFIALGMNVFFLNPFIALGMNVFFLNPFIALGMNVFF